MLTIFNSSGLYTRVESYLNWIQDVQKQEERLLKL